MNIVPPEVYIAKKYKKHCSISLTLSDMLIKTAPRFHLTSVRKAVTRKTSNSSTGGAKQALYIASGKGN